MPVADDHVAVTSGLADAEKLLIAVNDTAVLAGTDLAYEAGRKFEEGPDVRTPVTPGSMRSEASPISSACAEKIQQHSCNKASFGKA